MAAPSQTRICNAALAHLGEGKKITSIEDNTPLANVLKQTWDEARDEVLADHPWNFALRRKDQPTSDDAEIAGTEYDQAFAKPADCLRWLPYRPGHPDYFEGEEEGDFILSNAQAPIIVRYIARIEDVTRWTPGARAALAAKLAMINAKAITGQSGMIDRMSAIYDGLLSKAKRQDGAASGDRALRYETRSNWLGARNRRWNGIG